MKIFILNFLFPLDIIEYENIAPYTNNSYFTQDFLTSPVASRMATHTCHLYKLKN